MALVWFERHDGQQVGLDEMYVAVVDAGDGEGSKIELRDNGVTIAIIQVVETPQEVRSKLEAAASGGAGRCQYTITGPIEDLWDFARWMGIIPPVECDTSKIEKCKEMDVEEESLL